MTNFVCTIKIDNFSASEIPNLDIICDIVNHPNKIYHIFLIRHFEELYQLINFSILTKFVILM